MAEDSRISLKGLDQHKADLASVVFEAWRMLGAAATPQNASGLIAQMILDAGWRPPLPVGEIQWSVREQGDERFYYGPTLDEEDAREEAACREGNALGKRQAWYGPWVVVSEP